MKWQDRQCAQCSGEEMQSVKRGATKLKLTQAVYLRALSRVIALQSHLRQQHVCVGEGWIHSQTLANCSLGAIAFIGQILAERRQIERV